MKYLLSIGDKVTLHSKKGIYIVVEVRVMTFVVQKKSWKKRKFWPTTEHLYHDLDEILQHHNIFSKFR